MRAAPLALAALLALAPSTVLAKKKKAPPTSGEVKKGKDEKPPPPGDKRQNEGAQGRKNATEGASQSADSPQFEHRP